MPLDFKEVEPDPKAKENSQKAKLANLAERKGKGPTPLHLDSQVIPTLVRKIGDWKTGRISQAMCEAYLDRHTLVFDRELLTKMFTEADYQKEGSLDTRALTIAISGRFPKREHTNDWRALAALLLGLPELVLVEDLEAAMMRASAERPSRGTFNGTSIWCSPPPPLPPVRRPTASGRASSAGRGKEPSGEWNDTMSRTAAAAAIAGAAAAAASTVPGGLGATMRSGSAGGALDVAGALAGGGVGSTTAASVNGVVGTTGGLKQVTQIPDEERLNAALMGTSGGGARSTFGTLRDFNEFARGLEVAPQLATDARPASSGAAAGPGPGSVADSQRLTAARLGSPKDTVRVWAAPLPPSAISLPASALRTLRESVRSTASSKPEFARAFKPLDSHELDLKKTLGKDMDMEKSLSRVEPVRDTSVLPRADYVAWCDYAAQCRTSPSGWYSAHPVAAMQDTGEHKYPWC
ncbi:hypothetical protein VOLCADRAFT_117102 [Volvox carteri f. nagariensis]|uniref:Uncharacterized protein n=1 Tax=Volvox carteri f. nagariensis TaxID=3068 RepID=D8TS84_VOLCA|nr:uncharacterized protein VOLCADRAFT_117102 [Volvox carteri f. nagariensis]EFJ49647.1 hypothetical protein VOLCADRAFT_117102 [Volvox carteri f. nagariensis]|eukprot:XP_002949154.1 hypothetical protein VOLCADRAFT_117102 [Volvox carteri f. nagariensis]